MAHSWLDFFYSAVYLFSFTGCKNHYQTEFRQKTKYLYLFCRIFFSHCILNYKKKRAKQHYEHCTTFILSLVRLLQRFLPLVMSLTVKNKPNIKRLTVFQVFFPRSTKEIIQYKLLIIKENSSHGNWKLHSGCAGEY